jgi:hypothetical protein
MVWQGFGVWQATNRLLQPRANTTAHPINPNRLKLFHIWREVPHRNNARRLGFH